MKTSNRIISMILTLVMCLSLVSVPAAATDGAPGADTGPRITYAAIETEGNQKYFVVSGEGFEGYTSLIVQIIAPKGAYDGTYPTTNKILITQPGIKPVNGAFKEVKFVAAVEENAIKHQGNLHVEIRNGTKLITSMNEGLPYPAAGDKLDVIAVETDYAKQVEKVVPDANYQYKLSKDASVTTTDTKPEIITVPFAMKDSTARLMATPMEVNGADVYAGWLGVGLARAAGANYQQGWFESDEEALEKVDAVDAQGQKFNSVILQSQSIGEDEDAKNYDVWYFPLYPGELAAYTPYLLVTRGTDKYLYKMDVSGIELATVTFNPNNNTNENASFLLYGTERLAYGVLKETVPTPKETPEGKVFNGWYLSTDTSQTIVVNAAGTLVKDKAYEIGATYMGLWTNAPAAAATPKSIALEKNVAVPDNTTFTVSVSDATLTSGVKNEKLITVNGLPEGLGYTATASGSTITVTLTGTPTKVTDQDVTLGLALPEGALTIAGGLHVTGEVKVSVSLAKKNIAITAKNAADGAEISSPTLTVMQGQDTVTPTSGTYALTAEKTYTITAKMDGFWPVTEQLAVTTATTSPYELTMVPVLPVTATYAGDDSGNAAVTMTGALTGEYTTYYRVAKNETAAKALFTNNTFDSNDWTALTDNKAVVGTSNPEAAIAVAVVDKDNQIVQFGTCTVAAPEAKTITLSVDVSEHGSLTVMVNGTERTAIENKIKNVYKDAKVVVTAVPAANYDLGTLRVGGSAVEADKIENGAYTFTMPDADTTISATFTAKLYTVTGVENTAGKVSPDKTSCAADDTVTLTVTTAVGYRLKNLTVTAGGQENILVDYTDKPDAIPESTYTFTMPGANVEVNATFTKLIEVKYPVYKEEDHGKVTGTTWVAPGGTVSLNVTPDKGYQLGDGGVTVAPSATVSKTNGLVIDRTGEGLYTFTAPQTDGKITVSASFVEMDYYVTFMDNNSESYTFDGNESAVTGGGKNFKANDTVTLTVKPNTGNDEVYQLLGGASGITFNRTVELKVDNIDNEETGAGTYTFKMPSNDVIVTGVAFKKIPYTLSYESNSDGRVTFNKTTAVAGDTINLGVSANSGKVLTGLKFINANTTDDKGTEITNNTFTMPAYDVKVVATFEDGVISAENVTATTDAAVYVGQALTLNITGAKQATTTDGETKEVNLTGDHTVAILVGSGNTKPVVKTVAADFNNGAATIVIAANELTKSGDLAVSIDGTTVKDNVITVNPLNKYTVSKSVTGNGSVSIKMKGEGEESYTNKSYLEAVPNETVGSVQLTITPKAGYELDTLKVGGVDVTDEVSKNSYDFAIEPSANGTDTKVEAAFAAETYAVTLSDAGATKAFAADANKYEAGKPVTLKNNTLGDHQKITEVKVNGIPLTADSNGDYSFNMPASGATVTATVATMYTATFKNGSTTVATIDFADKGTITLPSAPTGSSRIFDYWKLADDTQHKPGAPYTCGESNLEFTAQWKNDTVSSVASQIKDDKIVEYNLAVKGRSEVGSIDPSKIEGNVSANVIVSMRSATIGDLSLSTVIDSKRNGDDLAAKKQALVQAGILTADYANEDSIGIATKESVHLEMSDASYSVVGDKKTFGVDIKPVLETTYTLGDGSVSNESNSVTKASTLDELTEEIDVSLVLPYTVENAANFSALHNPGDRYETQVPHTLSTEGGKTTVTITTKDFSPFAFTEVVAATIDDNNYGSVQAALNAAKNGDTVVVTGETGEDESVFVNSNVENVIIKNQSAYDVNLSNGITVNPGETSESISYSSGSTSPSGGGGGAVANVTVAKAANGSVKVSSTTAKAGDKVTVTMTPNSGYEADTLTVKDKNGKEITATKNSDGTYTFTMPAASLLPVTVTATFKATAAPSKTGFVDVDDDEYYAAAVEWAVKHDPQITNGTSETTFSPEMSCTRAQVVTFLWRAAGAPEPKTAATAFTDLGAASEYYYKAVLWAVENGITNGTSDTTFSPNVTVTRGQVVTFLYRYEKAASVAGSTFTDVAADAYYAPSVNWAYENGITTGTSSKMFSPDNDCTRAQIVTFLYRDMVK